MQNFRNKSPYNQSPSNLIAPKGWTQELWALIENYAMVEEDTGSLKEKIAQHISKVSEVHIEPDFLDEASAAQRDEEWSSQEDPKCLFDGGDACIDCLCIGKCLSFVPG